MDGDDLPIVELPEHYRVDGERLGMALAQVSAQAYNIAEHQAELQKRQARHEEEQQRFVEQRVAAAREEAEGRNNALVLAIQQTYGDPSMLEHRVDAQIQSVLQQLQNGAQEQARAFAEAQIADQVAANQRMEHQMHAAVQLVEQEVNERVEKRVRDLLAGIRAQQTMAAEELMRAADERRDIGNQLKYTEDQSQLAAQRAEDNARAFVNKELDARLNAVLQNIEAAAVARVETRVVEMVRGILHQHDSAVWMRHQQESEVISDHFEERLRQVVVVAKTAAESKVGEMMALHTRASGPEQSSTPTDLAEDADLAASHTEDSTAWATTRAVGDTEIPVASMFKTTRPASNSVTAAPCTSSSRVLAGEDEFEAGEGSSGGGEDSVSEGSSSEDNLLSTLSIFVGGRHVPVMNVALRPDADIKPKLTRAVRNERSAA
ncbi:hypothetical protein BBJ28_00026494, partial [Nothophytophthora sp. Chile5]